MYTLMFLISVAYLRFVSAQREHEQHCVDHPNERICYTVHKYTQFTQSRAAERCRQQTANGRLVTILDRLKESEVDSVPDKPHVSYWLGATAQCLGGSISMKKESSIRFQATHRNSTIHISAFSGHTQVEVVRSNSSKTARLVWNLGGYETEANYSNWADGQPDCSSSDVNKPMCVVASPGDRKWRTKNCDEAAAFVCESATPTTTSATTSASPDGIATTASEESKNLRKRIIKIVVVTLMLTVMIVIICLLVYFRRKLKLLQQTFASMQAFSGSGSGSRRPWSYRAPEDESFYALVNDADEMEDGYSTIGTAAAADTDRPAETRPKELPPYAVVKKIPKSQPAGADGGKQETENVMETTPAVHPKQSPENVAAAAAGNVIGYGSLQPAFPLHHTNISQRDDHHQKPAATQLGFDNLVYDIKSHQ